MSQELFDEALVLLRWARGCIYETEIEYGPALTDEQIERLPKAYRLRQNRNFAEALDKFYERCKQQKHETQNR